MDLLATAYTGEALGGVWMRMERMMCVSGRDAPHRRRKGLGLGAQQKVVQSQAS